MPDRSDLATMYAYNRWANGRALDAVSRLGPRQFTGAAGGSFGSVRDTLVHMPSAEWIWLERCRGTSPAAMLAPLEFPDIARLRTRWSDVCRGQAELLESVGDHNLRRMVTYVNTKGETWSYPLSEVLWHVVNHASYHRGQATTLLRQLGATPTPTDFLLFRDEGSPDR